MTRRLTGKILPVALLPLFLITVLVVSGQTNSPSGGTAVGIAGGTQAVLTPAAYTTGNMNWIRSWTVKKAGVTNPADVFSNTNTAEVEQTTQYIDGLGRPVQTVAKGISPSGNDLVSPVYYDEFGRESYKFLPYRSPASDGSFRQDPFNEQKSFYSSIYTADQPALLNEQFYYSHTQYEPSPLDRVNKTFSPGNSWAGSEGSNQEHASSVQYLVNNGNDNVRIWNITNDDLTYSNNDISTNIPTSPSAYNTGTLYKTVTLDEHNHAVVEYKDMEGRVVLKKVQAGNSITTDYSGQDVNWLCTYYVYDDFGLLRFVIPPKAVAAMVNAGSWDLTINNNVLINELCFRYEYDDRNRMIAKKVPGAGWVYMIYDKRDRLVFTQDGNMRNQPGNPWMYTLYDGLNRPVQTGMMTGYGGNANDLQIYVNGATGNGVESTITTNSTTAGATPVDIAYNTRDVLISDYKASNSITIDGGFTSEDNAEFTAEITTGNAYTNTTTTTVTDSPFPGTTTNIALTQTYYDDYSQASSNKGYTSANNGKLDQGNNTYADPLPSGQSTMTKGLVTSTKVRVIENPADLTLGNWMETVSYYDDKGRVVQSQSDNYKGGIDIVTSRYDFTGKAVCSYQAHSNPAAQYQVSVKTNMDYDQAGRVVTVRKTINDDATTTRTIEQNSYDALGQLLVKSQGQKKNADGSLSSTPINQSTYSYNIRGWLKGVNWGNYGGSGNTSALVDINNNKWFAMDLSYDWGYQNNQFNGNISGQRWMSGGDGQERSYGYGYDNVNRILYADFNQNFGGNWLKTDPGNSSFTIDFSMKMGDGINYNTAYDANGNILAMQQMGLKLNNSVIIDNLHYTYNNFSNKLQNVIDYNNDALSTLGDFKTAGSHPQSTQKAAITSDAAYASQSASINDYGYDVNGNLITDNNKSILGVTGIDQVSGGAIVYNHLNLPWQITVQGKGVITYIYDAAGNKLEKRTQDNATNKTTYTTYIGGFVYEDNALQFFGHEEGRVRVKLGTTAGQTPVYNYDYFVKDHLGNTRMVLTDEQQQDNYPIASMEPGNAAIENTYYANIDATRTSKQLYPGYPADNTTSPNDYVAKLNGSGNKIGPAMVLKVMAGDQVSVHVNSWFNTNGSSPQSPVDNPISDLVNALISAVPGASEGKIASSQLTSSVLSPSATGFITNRDNNYYNTGKPKAYLNILLLDEHMNPVIPAQNVGGTDSYVEQVNAENSLESHGVINRPITKNGYLYIYVSNETPNIDVLFDNLQVVHTRGPLVEETHYYPFGLTMQGISSKAAGKIENKYKYNKGSELQHQEFSDGSGLEWYDTHFRNLDPQLGRWWQIDPKPDYMQSLYVGMSNNPILRNDPLGDTLPTPHKTNMPDFKSIPSFYNQSGNSAVNQNFSTLKNNKGEQEQNNDAGNNREASSKNSEKKPLVGNTLTTKIANEKEIFNSGVGDQLTVSKYIGETSGKDGQVATNDVSVSNGKFEGTSVSVGGVVTFGVGTDKSASLGIGLLGVEIHVGVGVGNGLGQVSFGGSYTNNNGNSSGGDVTYKAGGVTATVVSVAYYVATHFGLAF